MDRPAFVYVTYIPTTPEKLWEALTEGVLGRPANGPGDSNLRGSEHPTVP
jgi:hypothetical protein